MENILIRCCSGEFFNLFCDSELASIDSMIPVRYVPLEFRAKAKAKAKAKATHDAAPNPGTWYRGYLCSDCYESLLNDPSPDIDRDVDKYYQFPSN